MSVWYRALSVREWLKVALQRLHGPIPYLPPPLPVGIHTFELMNPDSRLQIHHVIFKATFRHVIMLMPLITETLPGILGHAMQCQHFNTRRIPIRRGQ